MTISAPSMQKDVYKEFHVQAYHPSVSKVYINFTSRSGRLSNVSNNKRVMFVGLQYFIKDYLINEWNNDFFNLPSKEEAVSSHRRVLSAMLGYQVDVTYLENLYELGYLPLKVKALEEGSLVPYQVPVLTIENTVEGFQWLPNMIETVMSCENWPIQTSATTSLAYYKNFKKAFEETGLPQDTLPFMGHDFSFRGMMGRHSAAMSGFGHLCSGFAGTDTIPAVLFAEKYYNANVDKELVGCSVNSTEHSTTCSSILTIKDEISKGVRDKDLSLGIFTDPLLEAETLYYKDLMTNVSPTGILSLVADSYSFWDVVETALPKLKNIIMARNGKVVIRGDSGNPVEVLCGIKSTSVVADSFDEWKSFVAEYIDEEFREELDAEDPHCSLSKRFSYDGTIYNVTYTPELNRHDKTYYYVDNWKNDVEYCTFEEVQLGCEEKGLIECLWDTFGGTYTDKGYKVLDEHIGAIYGDAITLERQQEIFKRLKDKGFAPTVVLGIGSYSYQYVTRDTHGSAVKATNVVKGGEDMPIFKDPKTDSNKRSAKGLLRVEKTEDSFEVFDNQTREQEQEGELKEVFVDGNLVKETSLQNIRKLVNDQLT